MALTVRYKCYPPAQRLIHNIILAVAMHLLNRFSCTMEDSTNLPTSNLLEVDNSLSKDNSSSPLRRKSRFLVGMKRSLQVALYLAQFTNSKRLEDCYHDPLITILAYSLMGVAGCAITMNARLTDTSATSRGWETPEGSD